MPSPKQTVQIQSPRPPQLAQPSAERGSTSVVINPPPPQVGQPILVKPLQSGHSTIPPCITLSFATTGGKSCVYHLFQESARKKCSVGDRRPEGLGSVVAIAQTTEEMHGGREPAEDHYSAVTPSNRGSRSSSRRSGRRDLRPSQVLDTFDLPSGSNA